METKKREVDKLLMKTKAFLLLGSSVSVVMVSWLLFDLAFKERPTHEKQLNRYPSVVHVPERIPSISLEWNGIPDGDPLVKKVLVLGQATYLEGHYDGWRSATLFCAEKRGIRSDDRGPWKGREVMLVPVERYYDDGYLDGAKQCRNMLEQLAKRDGIESLRRQCVTWLEEFPFRDKLSSDFDDDRIRIGE